MGHQQSDDNQHVHLHSSDLPSAIKENFLADESAALRKLLPFVASTEIESKAIQQLTHELVCAIRNPESNKASAGFNLGPEIPFEDFLGEYNLATEEGIALMCLAEALLRIPDRTTAQALIEDKLSDHQWETHLGHSQSFWVNASTWGLLLTGKYFNGHQLGTPPSILKKIMQKAGAPLAEKAVRRAMVLMGDQFICGETIALAKQHSAPDKALGYIHSYDMLGEAALCERDVEQYFHSYLEAIESFRDRPQLETELDHVATAHRQCDSLSIKLSALHPRYEFHQQERVFHELVPRLKTLIYSAQQHQVPITLDAEESERLELSLQIFAELLKDPSIHEWPYLGIAVQAYQKRAYAVLEWLNQIANQYNTVIPVRLVKGAYWDSEIKSAQQLGLTNYPVWTRKENTDVSYLACAKLLFSCEGRLYPQFATHNAHTVASVLQLSETKPLIKFEFQRLYGMGEALYHHLIHLPQIIDRHIPIRIYTPVGSHTELLAYLVRRLLENGANTSFVHEVNDPQHSVEYFSRAPYDKVSQHSQISNPDIPLPYDLFAPYRKNSRAWNLNCETEFSSLLNQMLLWYQRHWQASPLSSALTHADQKALAKTVQPVMNPAIKSQLLGSVGTASNAHCDAALAEAYKAFPSWRTTPADKRAQCLDNLAELLESHGPELMALCVLEGGKTYPNAMAELREAVDFCRYYAAQCRQLFHQPIRLPGPTGEENTLSWQGRGVFLCISPWNFPLAIFTGQVAAALAAGNSVLAKPASNTTLISFRVIELFFEAGIPQSALHLLPCSGTVISESVITHRHLAGVAFTGSNAAAQQINRTLANRENASLATLIAETGGQNAMIVDSSALPEQVVKDVVLSAFDSAGQRCSALRVLFLQQETAPALIELLIGAMAELKIGDPQDPSTDIGPIIDAQAQQTLLDHIEYWQSKGKVLAQSPLTEDIKQTGFFVPPSLIELEHIEQLEEEMFGPVLHVIRYQASELDAVIESINDNGYGLTLGIHTRINAKARHICDRVNVGNVYVNRNMVGATVGVQPFGGMGLSGTGPKAGGPHYLQRFACEKTCSTNIAAVGGNPFLLNSSNSDFENS